MTPSDPLSSEVLRKLWPAIGLAVLAFTVVFVQPPAALAQEGEAEGMAAGDDAIKEEIKEEITVTARKRSCRLRVALSANSRRLTRLDKGTRSPVVSDRT